MSGREQLVAPVLDDATQRKALGKFYTPENVAGAIARWAVRRPVDRVLDPSFGGCAFLDAAAKRLSSFGIESPARLLYGMDVDSAAFPHLTSVPGAASVRSHFLKKDFLAVRIADLPERVDAVVGNPPYVRHHRLSSKQVRVAQSAMAEWDRSLPRTAGYWAYFVMHTLGFLKKGGRLGMVLPTALLSADYAAAVRKVLWEDFGQVRLLVVRERLFPGTDEASIIVLAEGFQEPG